MKEDISFEELKYSGDIQYTISENIINKNKEKATNHNIILKTSSIHIHDDEVWFPEFLMIDAAIHFLSIDASILTQSVESAHIEYSKNGRKYLQLNINGLPDYLSAQDFFPLNRLGLFNTNFLGENFVKNL